MTPREQALRAALDRMVQAFRPFTLRPIGAPCSPVRAEQDEQIQAHRDAVEALNDGSEPLPAVPFSWGLAGDERAVLIELLTKESVSREQLGRLAQGRDGQRPRKLMMHLRNVLRAVDPAIEIRTVPRQGVYMAPDAKRITLRHMRHGRW